MFLQDQTNPARHPKWFTLRVPGRETLTWEKELSDLGLTVWTPWMWVQKRKPRSKEVYWAQVPILGSYVFLAVEEVPRYSTLPAATLNAVKPMLIGGRFVLLEERDLDGLREYDMRDLDAAKIQAAMRRRAKRGKRAEGKDGRPVEQEVGLPSWSWAPGDRVRVKGVLAGVEGEVVRVQGEEVEVAIKIPAARLKVPGFLLEKA